LKNKKNGVNKDDANKKNEIGAVILEEKNMNEFVFMAKTDHHNQAAISHQ